MKFSLTLIVGGDSSTVLFYADNFEQAIKKATKIYKEMSTDAENMTFTVSTWHTIESNKKG